MLIPQAPGFDEPLEMLSACHGRIEDKLATLERLVPHLAEKGNDSDARAAARAVMRYFDTAGRLHHEDEDKDLFPLLRRRAAEQGRGEIAGVIDELGREHETMLAQWQRLSASLTAVAAGRGGLDSEQAAQFARLYRRHMAKETSAVLAFAAQVLSEAERRALGESMAARRGVRRA
jgi:hemerythrin-like domain-containing protein